MKLFQNLKVYSWKNDFLIFIMIFILMFSLNYNIYVHLSFFDVKNVDFIVSFFKNENQWFLILNNI
jgi:hypothetical protein